MNGAFVIFVFVLVVAFASAPSLLLTDLNEHLRCAAFPTIFTTRGFFGSVVVHVVVVVVAAPSFVHFEFRFRFPVADDDADADADSAYWR